MYAQVSLSGDYFTFMVFLPGDDQPCNLHATLQLHLSGSGSAINRHSLEMNAPLIKVNKVNKI